MKLPIAAIFTALVICCPYSTYGGPRMSLKLCEMYANSLDEVPIEMAVYCNILADQVNTRHKREYDYNKSTYMLFK